MRSVAPLPPGTTTLNVADSFNILSNFFKNALLLWLSVIQWFNTSMANPIYASLKNKTKQKNPSNPHFAYLANTNSLVQQLKWSNSYSRLSWQDMFPKETTYLICLDTPGWNIAKRV